MKREVVKKAKRLLVSLMASALVMGNVFVLTTFISSAEEDVQESTSTNADGSTTTVTVTTEYATPDSVGTTESETATSVEGDTTTEITESEAVEYNEETHSTTVTNTTTETTVVTTTGEIEWQEPAITTETDEDGVEWTVTTTEGSVTTTTDTSTSTVTETATTNPTITTEEKTTTPSTTATFDDKEVFEEDLAQVLGDLSEYTQNEDGSYSKTVDGVSTTYTKDENGNHYITVTSVTTATVVEETTVTNEDGSVTTTSSVANEDGSVTTTVTTTTITYAEDGETVVKSESSQQVRTEYPSTTVSKITYIPAEGTVNEWTGTAMEYIADGNGKIYGVDGTEVDKATADTIMQLFDILTVTENYGVYANEYVTGCEHVEGNIAVNVLTNTSRQDTYMPNRTNGLSDDVLNVSFVGSTTTGTSIRVEDSGTLVLGGSGVTEDTSSGASNGTFVDLSENVEVVDGTAKIDGAAVTDALANTLTEEYNYSEEKAAEVATEIADQINISHNLSNNEEGGIAEKAEAVVAQATQASNASGSDSQAAINTVTNLLNSADSTVKAGDVVVINVSAADLQNNGTIIQNDLQSLYNANQNVGAKILLNIDTSNYSEASIEICQPLNPGQDHSASTASIIWNFGSYDGEITYTSTVTGLILAANATVNATGGVLFGNVVADSYIRDNAIEDHQANVQTITLTTTTSFTAEKTENSETTTKVSMGSSSSSLEIGFSSSTETVTDPVEEIDRISGGAPTPEVTPEVTPTPETTPEVTPTPETTPEVTPSPETTPEVTPSPETTPETTPTVTITDTPTPTSATPTATVTITDTPVPLGETPEDGEVLGARRTPMPQPQEEGEVLGARRAPQTGDSAQANVWLALLFGATAGMGTWAFMKKRDEKKAQQSN